MPTTGSAPAPVCTGTTGIDSDRENTAPQAKVSDRVREGANWFFWIAALATMTSVVTMVGSHIHRFTGFGVTALVDTLAQSGSSRAMDVIFDAWLAGGLVVLGFFAVEGQKWAFVVGMVGYTLDGALSVAAGDYLGAGLHALVLYFIYRGFAALGQPSDVASAAHAG